MSEDRPNRPFGFRPDIDGWLEYFGISKPLPGGCDILCAGGTNRLRAATSFMGALSTAKKPNGELYYLNAFVIFPAEAFEARSSEQIITEFFEELTKCVSQDVAERAEEVNASAIEKAFRRHISVRISKTAQLSDLVELITSLPNSSAVFVMNAESYAADQGQAASSTPRGNAQGHETVRTTLEEDVWVRGLYQTASSLTHLAANKELYVFLFVQKFGPARSENSELLKSIDDCSFSSVELPEDERQDQAQIMNNMVRWLSLARQSKIEEVIKEVDQKPIRPINQAMVKAQCLMVAGRSILGFHIVRPFLNEITERGVPQIVLIMAKLAMRAGEHSISLDLLRAGIQGNPATEIELNLALEVGRALGADKEVDLISGILIRLYPHARTVLYHKLSICREPSEFANLADEIRGEADVADVGPEIKYIYMLASVFGSDETPDYDDLIQRIANVLPDYELRAALTCATHALRQGRFDTVVRLCLSVTWPLETQEDAAWHMVKALDGLFLRKQQTSGDLQAGMSSEDFEDIVKRCLIFVLTYLGEHPFDGHIRAGLYRTLSPETSGLHGISYLTHVVLNAAPPKVSKLEDVTALLSADSLPDADFVALSESIISNLSVPMVLGLGKLPDVEPRSSLASFLKSIVLIMQHASTKEILDETELGFIQLLLHVAILVARAIGREQYLPELIDIVASGLATSGHYQSSRNLAELCLQLSSESSSGQKREAWLAYSDIYLRCHNPVEALIGLGSALHSSTPSIAASRRYHEILLSCRVLRDLHLFPLALPLLQLAREQAIHTANPAEAMTRVDYYEAGLRFQMLMHTARGATGSVEFAGLRDFATEVVELNRRARDQGIEILPTALLLAHVRGILVLSGQPIDDEVEKELNESLDLVGGKYAVLLRGFATAEASAEAIEVLGTALSRTRYTEDLGTDVAVITLLARRALGGVAKVANVAKALFLIEWVTDLSINTIETDRFTRSDSGEVAESTLRRYSELMSSRPDILHEVELGRLRDLTDQTDPSLQVENQSYPRSADDLMGFAQKFGRALDLHSFGLSDDGSLVRVSIGDSKFSVVVEPTVVFDSDAHREWEKSYPYGYRFIRSDDPLALNTVEHSLAGIGIAPEDSSRPTLFIPDVRLQNIPPNLLLINGRFGALSRPIAAAPSLTWLQDIHSLAHSPGLRRNAWIPASSIPGDVLLRLSQNLSDTLNQHGFIVSHDRFMPTDMEGSDIAIVGAHGGLRDYNEWFSAVSDEGSTRLGARAVAGKLRGSSVVILFVCSGGRLDPHPYASAGVGLARQLLDYGCRTVIASPWPIDVRVATYWLPAFLESFTGGEKIITANYVANRKVAEAFSPHPMIALAMNVYGDPLTAEPS